MISVGRLQKPTEKWGKQQEVWELLEGERIFTKHGEGNIIFFVQKMLKNDHENFISPFNHHMKTD